MKKLFLLAIMAILASEANSQLKQFTLEDLNFGGKNYKEMSPKRLKLWWDGNTLVNSDERKKPEAYPQVTSREHNIFIKTSADAKEIQLTKDGTREIVYGEAVHRNEFGIDGGIFMSPDKKKFAFYRMDQSMVTDYPQVDIDPREATYEPDKYPMAGETSHKVTIGIAEINNEKTENKDFVWLDLGDVTDRYFTNIVWSPDSKTLYVIELNRDQTDMSLDAYDTQTGKKIKTLYTEHNDKYVEPLHPIEFLPWDDSEFITWSQRDGYMHLYLMDVNGKLLKQLTKGQYVVSEILGFCTKTKSVIIRSNMLNPLQMNLFRLSLKPQNLKTSGPQNLTLLDNGIGVHYGKLSDDGTMLLDTYSAPDIPRCYEVTNTVKGTRKEYFRSPNPWEGYAVPTYKMGSIKAADGKTDLYYRMVLPPDFPKDASLPDSGSSPKKYPTIVYVYGGPHAHNVDASWHWASRSWETYMAQKGYILFILDNRGSENRGLEFEQATFRHLGQVEMKDQMEGVKYLQSLPYIDKDRIGVHGWSFGGFMTISLITNYPDVFKVGVAGGPVIDWKWYEVMYGERYMDTPQTNPDGYAETSLIPKAKDLKGRLLIIEGYNDKTVVPQHCLSFLKACSDAGTYPDFFMYPGEGHNMRGHRSVHLHEMISRYFDDFLLSR